MRISQFINFPLYLLTNVAPTDAVLRIRQFYIPGSISFNTVAWLGHRTGGPTVTASFGLYSLNGSTLSLANSASNSFNVNNTQWRTMVTSATQDITPGNWYLAWMHDDSTGSVAAYCQDYPRATDGGPGGPFFAGSYSVTTTAFPASIDTSEMNLIGTGLGTEFFPVILISA